MNYLKEYHDYEPPREVVILKNADNFLPIFEINCSDLRLIGEAWLAMPRVSGEELPRWSAFRPKDFVSCLDKFCVLKVEDWKADKLEFSLYGGHPTDYIGCGKPLVMQQLRRDPLRSANYYDIRDRAGRAIDNKAPQFVRKTLSWNANNYIEYETLMLPFMAEGGVQRVLQPVSARAMDKSFGAEPSSVWCRVADINKRRVLRSPRSSRGSEPRLNCRRASPVHSAGL